MPDPSQTCTDRWSDIT